MVADKNHTFIAVAVSIAFLALCFQNPLFAHDYEQYEPEYVAAIHNFKALSYQTDKAEGESSLRRFEITFIISLPFVFLSNFIILHVADVIIEGDPNVSVWENHGPFLALNTLMISSIIAFREARIAGDKNRMKASPYTDGRLYVPLSVKVF